MLPQLTVIIPTLNRSETLFHTIRTALVQDYENYSILVSDNLSDDNTKEIVESFKDDRIKYINPGIRLSMSHHWEFALQNVQDGYVTILGDDDGLLPNSLNKVANLLNKYQTEAVGWKFCNYNWQGLPAYFMIPISNYYRLVNSKSEIKKIFQQSIYSSIQFPSLYGGFISMDLINKLKKNYNGKFFHSRIPDFFSGAMIAASTENYLRLEIPITINATSKYSAGYATVSKQNKQTAFIDLQTGKDNIPFHPSLVFIRSNAVPIAEAMLQVHELFPDFPKPDIKKLLQEVLKEACADTNKEKFEELKLGIMAIAKKNNLENYACSLIQSSVYSPKIFIIKKKFSPVSMNLYIDTSKTDIKNVQDACNFAAEIIPKKYFWLRNNFLKNYFRILAALRFLYLKLFSSKRKFL